MTVYYEHQVVVVSNVQSFSLEYFSFVFVHFNF